MLVLFRSPGETILIGDDMSVTVDFVAVSPLDGRRSGGFLVDQGSGTPQLKIRNAGEDIVVSHDVYVRILGIQPNRSVTMGVSAPRYIDVDRAEIRGRKDAERAAQGNRVEPAT